MRKSLNNHEVLYQVIDAISSLGIEVLLAKIDALVEKMTNADSTGIYTLDEKTQSVVLRASKLHFDIVGKLKMKIGEGITGWVAKYGKTVAVERNAKSDPRFTRVTNLPDDLYESFLSVPIKSNNVIVGVINVKHKFPHKYPKDQVKLLEMLGKLIGRAVEHADLLERTKTLEEAVTTQKVVSQAKGILASQMRISENEAYHVMRRQAMKARKNIRQVAEAIITTAELTTDLQAFRSSKLEK